MNEREVDIFKKNIHEQFECGSPELYETHISWVILCDDYAFKVKKPIRYPFLDFTTIKKRKFYCEEEIRLNSRLTSGIYLDVFSINKNFKINGDEEAVDYCVRMKKLNNNLRMDRLLRQKAVPRELMDRIADQLNDFHNNKAERCYDKDLTIEQDFKDILPVAAQIEEHLDKEQQGLLEKASQFSGKFLKQQNAYLRDRMKSGLIRDCHGDLHSRNIFLYEEPVIFDCIEFNESFRQIDILNELAFFCMDLEYYRARHLSEYFLTSYIKKSEISWENKERTLFTYYKMYRANVRAKVNMLRVKDATDPQAHKEAKLEIEKYLKLLSGYYEEIHKG